MPAPEALTCREKRSATDSGDACSCQLVGVTSTQRIHRGGGASPADAAASVGASASRQRASAAAASSRAAAHCPSSSLRSANSAELGRQAIERGGELVERGACSRVAPAPAPRASFAGVSPSGEAQLADRRRHAGGGVGQVGDLARTGARGDLGVARELRELPRRDLLRRRTASPCPAAGAPRRGSIVLQAGRSSARPSSRSMTSAKNR